MSFTNLVIISTSNYDLFSGEEFFLLSWNHLEGFEERELCLSSFKKIIGFNMIRNI